MPMPTAYRLPALTAVALALIAGLSVAIFLTALSPTAAAHDNKAHDAKSGHVHAEVGAIALSHAWARATPPGAKVGGGYVTLKNTGAEDDRLTGGSAPFAGRVEVHSMEMDGEVMKMAPVEGGLAVPAGESVTLEPGGLHIMFMGLKEPLTADSMVSVTLTFERAGSVEVPFHVAPMGSMEHGHGHGHGEGHGGGHGHGDGHDHDAMPTE